MPAVAPPAVSVLSGKKLLPYGAKAKAFAKSNPRVDPRISILEGAIRSAKTWAMIPKLIQLCDYQVAGHRVITGVSKNTIYNNVLNDLFEIFGEGNYTFNRQSGELNLMGSKWNVIGAKDEGSEKYIRGLTVGIAYGDELTLQPPSFVRMLLNRMSPAGARAYFTTNPDTPFHYVKTDLIDNEELIKNGSLKSIHFTLDDNPNITGLSDTTEEGRKANAAYRAHLRAIYKGVYYQRFVLGLWVVAEGGIYKDVWNEECLYDDKPWEMSDGKPGAIIPDGLRIPSNHAERYIGVDCGVDHPQVYLDVIDDGEKLWVDRELVWDSNVELRQKTDAEYRKDLEEFIVKAPDAQTIIPPECASFRAECVQASIWLTDADNEVLDGLKITASMMGSGRLKVHRRCNRLRQGIESHVWDPKAKLRGIEQPLKQKDDEVDALRYVVKTKIAPWRLALPD